MSSNIQKHKIETEETPKKIQSLASMSNGSAYISRDICIFKDGSPGEDCDWGLVVGKALVCKSGEQEVNEEGESR